MNPMQQWTEQHGPLNDHQKTIRGNVRNFCCGLDHKELIAEEKSRRETDPFRSVCIQEWIFQEYPQ